MGVLNGRDLLSSKYITAIITDSEDRGYFVPIKVTIGDYFVTELNGGLYAFTLRNARIITHKETLTKSFRFVEFDTSHFMSIKAETKELEMVLRKNMIPRLNTVGLAILKLLGRKERIENLKQTNLIRDKMEDNPDYKFTPHDIQALIEEIAQNAQEYPEESMNMINYLKSLDIDRIVTPVRRVSEFLEDDLVATVPSFLGELLPRYARLDNENRKITNKQLTGRKSWLMPLLIFMFIGMGAFMIYWMYDNGFFDSITSMFPNPDSFVGIGDSLNPASLQGGTGNPYSDTAMQAKYTPEELAVAVQTGEVPYEKLSSTMKKLVDSVELPKVVPNP